MSNKYDDLQNPSFMENISLVNSTLLFEEVVNDFFQYTRSNKFYIYEEET